MKPSQVEDLHEALATAGEAVRDAAGGRDDPDDLIARLVAAAAKAVPGVNGAGITVVERDGQLSSRAPSDPWVADLDLRQNELGEGPCVAAAHPDTSITAAITTPGPHAMLTVTNMSAQGLALWPRWAPEAIEAGVHSLMAVNMTPPDGGTAALNLYSSTDDAFDLAAQLAAEAFAGQIAVGLFGSRRAADLTSALATRDVIGQAKGILIARMAVTGERAFQILVRASQDTNIKLADVARWLVTDAEQNPGPRSNADHTFQSRHVTHPPGRASKPHT